MPFVTGWMGENHFAAVPTALYGVVLLMAGIAYYDPAAAIIAAQGPRLAARDGGRDATSRARSRRCSTLIAIPLAFVHEWIADALYVLVALMWLVPDRRIERTLPPGAQEGAAG